MKLVEVFNHHIRCVSSARVIWNGHEFLLGNTNADLDIPGCSTMVNEHGELVQVSRDGLRYLVQVERDHYELRQIGLQGPKGIILADTAAIVIPRERSES